MPAEILYAVITFLGVCVIILGGLWIKDIMTHRQWAIEQIAGIGMKVAILEKTYIDIKDELKEMKELLKLLIARSNNKE